MGGWGSRWPRPPSPAPLVFAVTSMQSPVWSPVSFCHPSDTSAISWRRLTPTGAQSSATSPRRPWPNFVLALPTDRCHPRIAWATICRYLCLLGRQHPECPSLYLFWVLFCTERERGTIFQERDRRQETRKRLQPLALANQLHMASCFWGPAPATTLSRALMVACRRDRPGASACCPICAPELDEATVAASAEPPPSPQVWDPSRPGRAMPCGLSASFQTATGRMTQSTNVLRLQSHLALTGSSHAACLPSL